jgi:hypothetical protein
VTGAAPENAWLVKLIYAQLPQYATRSLTGEDYQALSQIDFTKYESMPDVAQIALELGVAEPPTAPQLPSRVAKPRPEPVHVATDVTIQDAAAATGLTVRRIKTLLKQRVLHNYGSNTKPRVNLSQLSLIQWESYKTSSNPVPTAEPADEPPASFYIAKNITAVLNSPTDRGGRAKVVGTAYYFDHKGRVSQTTPPGSTSPRLDGNPRLLKFTYTGRTVDLQSIIRDVSVLRNAIAAEKTAWDQEMEALFGPNS